MHESKPLCEGSPAGIIRLRVGGGSEENMKSVWLIASKADATAIMEAANVPVGNGELHHLQNKHLFYCQGPFPLAMYSAITEFNDMINDHMNDLETIPEEIFFS